MPADRRPRSCRYGDQSSMLQHEKTVSSFAQLDQQYERTQLAILWNLLSMPVLQVLSPCEQCCGRSCCLTGKSRGHRPALQMSRSRRSSVLRKSSVKALTLGKSVKSICFVMMLACTSKEQVILCQDCYGLQRAVHCCCNARGRTDAVCNTQRAPDKSQYCCRQCEL